MSFGDRHNINPIRDHCPVDAESLPQKPLDPVAARRVAGLAADRKAKPEMTRLSALRQHEKNKPLGIITPPPLVTREKLRAAHQTVTPGKT